MDGRGRHDGMGWDGLSWVGKKGRGKYVCVCVRERQRELR